jgi:hypothetical protein
VSSTASGLRPAAWASAAALRFSTSARMSTSAIAWPEP